MDYNIPDFSQFIPSDDSDADSTDGKTDSPKQHVLAPAAAVSGKRSTVPVRQKLSDFAPAAASVSATPTDADDSDDKPVDEAYARAELAAVDARLAQGDRNGYRVIVPGRVLLHEGVLNKKGVMQPVLCYDVHAAMRAVWCCVAHAGMESRVKRTNPRAVFLFNDSLLLTKAEGKGKLSFKDDIPLSASILRDRAADAATPSAAGDAHSFEVVAPKKTYVLLAPSAADKAVWMEQIGNAMWKLAPQEARATPGWRHHIVTGTVYHAAMMGDVAALQSLIAGQPEDDVRLLIDRTDKAQWSPLQYACYYGHAEVVQLLFAHGATRDVVTSAGQSLLHLAASRGHLDVVTLLLDNGVDVDAVDNDGCTPLLSALQQSTHRRLGLDVVTAVASTLIAHNADVNARSASTGDVALLLAVDSGAADVIQHMSTRGVMANVKVSATMATPLHVAVNAESVSVAVITALLKVPTVGRIVAVHGS